MRSLVLAAVVIAAGAAAGARAAEAPPSVPVQKAIAAAQEMERRGAADSALAVLDPALRSARAARDEGSAGRLLLEIGMALLRTGRAVQAEPRLSEAVTAAEAVLDTTLLCNGLYRLAQTMDAQGQPPRALPVYERLLATSSAAHELAFVGRGQMMLARRSLQSGDLDDARRRLDEADAALTQSGAEEDAKEALFYRGLLRRETGDFDGARAAWEECLSWAKQHRDPDKTGVVLNNLALLDMSLGDPSRAADRWGEAHAVLLAEGRLRAAFLPAKSAALALRDLGRYDDAAAILEQQLDVARSHGYTDFEASALVDLGGLAERRGRDDEAVRRYQEALAHLDAGSRVEVRADALLGLVRALTSEGQALEGLALLEGDVQALVPRADVSERVEIERVLGAQYLLVRRPADARAALVRALALTDSVGNPPAQLRALPLLARAYRQLEKPDSAIACGQAAVAAWEAERAVPLDPEWREQRDASAAAAFTDLGDLLLDEPRATPDAGRVTAAFELLQRYKARMLREQMLGPSVTDSAREEVVTVTLAGLRHSTLHDGELLLDAYVGPEKTLVFAVTRDGCRVRRLPGVDEGLRALVDRYLVGVEPVSARSTSAPVAEAAADTLSAWLFGDLTDVLARTSTILFAPDGVLNQVSLADLPMAGAPLVERYDLVRVPSAAFLVGQRARKREGGSAQGIVALEARGKDRAALPGATEEAGMLARRFQGVRILAAPDSAQALVDALHGRAVLHAAAHAEVDDQHPWRSGLRVGSVPGDKGVFRANSVASLRIAPSLAFLSGCETAGGRVLSGEGVAGLTSALLVAGVPTVIAALRPVDDRATVELVRRFYEGLSHGRTAKEALREAQRAVRKDATTAHASYWSPFVLVGDGDARVKVGRRFVPGPALYLGLAVVCLVGWSAWKRRRIERKSEGAALLTPLEEAEARRQRIVEIGSRPAWEGWVSRVLMAASLVFVALAGWQTLHRAPKPELSSSLRAAPRQARWDMIVWDPTTTGWPLEWDPVVGAASYIVRLQTESGDALAEVPAGEKGVEVRFDAVPAAHRNDPIYAMAVAVGTDGPITSTRARFLPRR